MMPKLCILLIILLATNVYASDLGAPQVDKFVSSFLAHYESSTQPFTSDQKDALRAVFPMLALVPQDKAFREYFWSTVRGEKREIDWATAAQMIRNGEIQQVSQNHDLSVIMVTYDGVMLTTKAPTIDEAYRTMGEVDPKRVFITFSTE